MTAELTPQEYADWIDQEIEQAILQMLSDPTPVPWTVSKPPAGWLQAVDQATENTQSAR